MKPEQCSEGPSNSLLGAGGYLRLRHIIGDRKAQPPIHPLIPVSRTTWLEGVKSGRYPKSVKLGPRITAWRAEDIRALIANAPAR